MNSDKNNVAPVVGLAYTPRFSHALFGNDATVIRAGFRVGYDDVFNNIPANMGLNAPYSLTTNQTANVTQPGKFPWAIGYNQNVPLVSNFGKQGPGTPTSGAGQLQRRGSEPAQRLHLSVQLRHSAQDRQRLFDRGRLPGIERPQAAAQHRPERAVRHGDRSRPSGGKLAPNQQVFPYPTFAGINMGKDIANSNYNGLVLTSRYQGRRGIFLQASYTFGKSLDNSSSWSVPSGQPGGVADPRNLRSGVRPFELRHPPSRRVHLRDRPAGRTGPSAARLEQRHQSPGVRRLADFRNHHRAERRAVHGLQQLDRFQRIQPVLRPSRRDRNRQADSRTTGIRMRRSTRPSSRRLRRPGAWARPAAISTTDRAWSTSISRRPRASRSDTERLHLQFRADLFNLFNHTNFSNPISNQSSANFGKITSTVGSAVATAVGTTAGLVGGGPRVVQFSMRLSF